MSEQLRWTPAWYGDPTGRHDHRWWDGEAWTAHVADGGIAARDELEGAEPPVPPTGASGPSWRSAEHEAGVAVRPRNESIAIVALVAASLALFAAFVPFLGLAVALPAFFVALVARRRVRERRPEGSGPAVGALVLSSIALAIALVISATGAALMRSSGGELTEAFRAYVDCLETQGSAECRVLLEETLERITR
jgi:hypothetical protein